MKKRTLFFLFFIFSHCAIQAQGLQIGISAKPLISYPGFDVSYVYQAVHYQPAPSRAFGIILRGEISPRWNWEMGISSIRLGYRMNYVRTYVAGQRITHNSVGGQRWSMFEIPIGVQYKIGKPDRKWRFSIHAGANITLYPISGEANMSMSSIFKSDVRSPNTPREMVISHDTYIKSFTKVNPYLKVSMERKIGMSQYFSLGLIHSQGVSVMYDTKVSYTAQGEDFENHIYTRGSYTGLQITYFFTVLKTKNK
jgi:hypothetical protein